jgi:hypothetical protein
MELRSSFIFSLTSTKPQPFQLPSAYQMNFKAN